MQVQILNQAFKIYFCALLPNQGQREYGENNTQLGTKPPNLTGTARKNIALDKLLHL